MTNIEKIFGVVSRQVPSSGICDDCLERMADVHPRQQVNQICRRLEAEGRIARKLGSCAAKKHGVEKVLNFLKADEDVDRPPDLLPDLQEQTDVLSQWLFDAASFLDRVENISRSKEPFAARVSRLKHEGRVPSSLSNRMQTLNNFRVQVVKERKMLDATEWKLAAKYIDECRHSWAE